MQLTNRKTALGIGLGLAILGAGVVGVAGLLLYSNANPCCVEEDYAMMFSSAILYSGSASTPFSRGTAVFTFSIPPTHDATAINSVTITGASFLLTTPSVLECSNNTFCTPFDHVPLPADRVSNFDTNTTAFYISSPVVENDTYNFVINFANGQSVSGSLAAKPPTTLPPGPTVTYSSMSISTVTYYSPSCTIQPYTTSAWENISGTIFTTVETVSC